MREVGEILGATGAAAGVALLVHGYLKERKGNKAIRHKLETPLKFVVPRSNHVYDPKENIDFLKRLYELRRPKNELYTKGPVKFIWRVIKNENGEVQFSLEAPKDREYGVTQSLPKTLEWEEKKQYGSEQPKKEQITKSSSSNPVMWVGASHEILPIRAIGSKDVLPGILDAMIPGMSMEIVFTPADNKQVERIIKRHRTKMDPNVENNSAWSQLGKEFANVGRDVVRDLGNEFTGSKRAATPYTPQQKSSPPRELDPREREKLNKVVSRYSEINDMFEATIKFELHKQDPNPGAYFQGVLSRLVDLNGQDRLINVRRSKPGLYSAAELANFVHIPGVDEYKQMPIILEHVRTLKEDEFNEGVAVGYLRHPLQVGRLVKIPVEQFKRHVLLSGGTGSGKSTTIVFMIHSMIEEWLKGNTKNPQPGFTFIDPAAETVFILLSHLQSVLPEGDPRWNKVHYLSFSNQEYPVGLNILEIMTPESVLETLTKAYGGGASIDNWIDKSVSTLQEDHSVKHVLAGIVPLLQNEDWRLRVVQNVKSELLKIFWESQEAKLSKDPGSTGGVERRLRMFTSGGTNLYFNQPDYSLPIREWMDEGHIFLVDMKGLGGSLTELLIGSMIERYHRITQQRPSSSAMTHFLVVDECHRVQTESMQKIIVEDRKFGLSLVMITQSVAQFNTELKREIKDNIGTVISLRQGLEGSKTASELSQGHFSEKYLRELDDNVAAVYTRVGGVAASFETKAPFPQTYQGFYPNVSVVNFNDKPSLENRYKELESYGYNMQKEIGRPAKDVEESLSFYLSKGYWPKEIDSNKPVHASKEKNSKRATRNRPKKMI